jgi:hypothetical protein
LWTLPAGRLAADLAVLATAAALSCFAMTHPQVG